MSGKNLISSSALKNFILFTTTDLTLVLLSRILLMLVARYGRYFDKKV